MVENISLPIREMSPHILSPLSLIERRSPKHASLLHVGSGTLPATTAIVLQSIDQRQLKGKEAQRYDLPEVSEQHFPEREEL